MATICKIGETKEIKGELYRKASDTKAGPCYGCAFRSGVCPGNIIGAAIENGGSECRDSIWKRVRVPPQIGHTKAPKAKLKNQIAKLKKKDSK